MQPSEIKDKIESIRTVIDDVHSKRPLTPEEKARLLQVLVYLRFRNECLELS